MQWSDFDLYMLNIQNGHFPHGRKYAGYGDSAFAGNNHCIRTCHEPPLTLRQSDENKHMKRVQESIEHDYHKKDSLNPLVKNRVNFKLGLDGHICFEAIRVSHLISNIHMCLYGHQVSCDNTFGCAPPQLEDYLIP
jgi:hypothetical protein